MSHDATQSESDLNLPTFADLRAELAADKNIQTVLRWLKEEILSVSDQAHLAAFFAGNWPKTRSRAHQKIAKRWPNDVTRTTARSRLGTIADTAQVLIDAHQRRIASHTYAQDDIWPKIVRPRMQELGIGTKKLSKATRVPSGTLYHWISGYSRPSFTRSNNSSMRERLARVADVLGIDLTLLISSVSNRTLLVEGRFKPAKKFVPAHVAYYLRKEHWPTTLSEDFKRLVEFHTALVPPPHPDHKKTAKRRRGNSRWQGITPEKNSSIALAETNISSFFGYCILPLDKAHARALVKDRVKRAVSVEETEQIAEWLVGAGLSAELQNFSFASLLDTDCVQKWLEWTAKRNSGYSEYQDGCLTRLRSWFSPEYGFITQDYDIAARVMGWESLPTGRMTAVQSEIYWRRMREWEEICRETNRTFKQIRDSITSHKNSARKPPQTVRLDPIYRHPDPLQLLEDMIERYRISEPNHLDRGGESWLVWCRNMALLELLRSNPIRNRNIREMTYRPDGTGSLRRQGSKFLLYYVPHQVKNPRPGKRIGYEALLSERASSWVDFYLENVWPNWPRSEKAAGDEVFLTRRGNPFTKEALSQEIKSLTEDFLGEELPGFRTHAIRHIIATGWLKRHPNEFNTVALLLNDKLETVMETYAHLRVDDGMKKHHEEIDAAPLILPRATKTKRVVNNG